MKITARVKEFFKTQVRSRYLPCYVYHKDPMIVFAYDSDFTSNAESFLRCFLREKQVYLFLQLGWQHETDRTARPFAKEILEFQSRCFNTTITVLANSMQEVKKLNELGVRTVFCHQNAFLDENRYPLLLHPVKKYDALYIARITPFKRHELAKGVRSLRLIGDFSQKEAEYAHSVREELSHADYTRKIPASQVFRAISEARCGLCLSKEEGAMFVSMEYLLCGIPVVSTENIGGRNTMFPEFACKMVEDTPEAVAEAVKEYRTCTPAPERIRKAVLCLMQDQRQILLNMLRETLSCHNQELASDVLPHKLGLRCTLPPWTIWKHGLKR